MPNNLRDLTNKTGVVYNATKTTILFAEDWALLKSWISYFSDLFSKLPTSPYSEIVVQSSNSVGTTNNAIKRFQTLIYNNGIDITRASTVANGDSFTINTDGIYTIIYQDVAGNGADYFGISVNSNQLTTAIVSITASNRKGFVTCIGAGHWVQATATLNLSAGNVVRAHYGKISALPVTASFERFTITRVK